MGFNKDQTSKPAPPLRPLTAFFIFKANMFEQVKKENPDAKITEIPKIISEKWKELPEETKAIYELKNQEAKARYEKEIKEYEEKYGKIEKKRRRVPIRQQNEQSNTPSEDSDEDNQRVKGKKPEKQAAPLPPRRPLTAFFIYKADMFERVKKENPDAKVTEITKIICDKWTKANEEVKEPYMKKNEEAKKNYEKELQEYEQKYGKIPVGEKRRARMRQQRDSSSENEQSNSPSEDSDEDNEPVKDKKPEKQAAPLPPRRPLTAFFIYKADMFERVKKENPDAKVTEITKIICEKWKELPEETKAIYELRSQEAKKNYEKELQEYEQKYGKLQKKKRVSKKRQDSSSDGIEESAKKSFAKPSGKAVLEDEDEEEFGEPCNKVSTKTV